MLRGLLEGICYEIGNRIDTMGAYRSVEDAFKEVSQNDEVKVYLPNEKYAQAYERYKGQMNHLYKRIWNGRLVEGNYEFRI